MARTRGRVGILLGALLGAAALFRADPVAADAPAPTELERTFAEAVAAGDAPGAERAARALCRGGAASGEAFLAARLGSLPGAIAPRVAAALGAEAREASTFAALARAAGDPAGGKGAAEATRAMAARLRDDEMWALTLPGELLPLRGAGAAAAFRSVGQAGGAPAKALLRAALGTAVEGAALAALLEAVPGGDVQEPETLDALARAVADPSLDPAARAAALALLGRSGRAAAPALVAVLESAASGGGTDAEVARLAGAARTSLVKLAGGVDHGLSPAEWRRALESARAEPAPVAAAPVAAAPAPAPAAPDDRFDWPLAAAVAALVLSLLALASVLDVARGGPFHPAVLVPAVPVLALVGLTGRPPAPAPARPAAEAAVLTPAAKADLCGRLWNYLAARQAGRPPVDPGFHPRAAADVSGGVAFAPLVARFEDAREIALVEAGPDTATLYLRLTKGRVVRGQLAFELRSARAEVRGFRFEGMRNMTEPEWLRAAAQSWSSAPEPAPAPVAPVAGVEDPPDPARRFRIVASILAYAFLVVAAIQLLSGRAAPGPARAPAALPAPIRAPAASDSGLEAAFAHVALRLNADPGAAGSESRSMKRREIPDPSGAAVGYAE